MKVSFNNRGFSTLAEIILVMGIMSIIFSIGLLSFPKVQQRANITSAADTFLADFKEQQIRAMTGDSESGTLPDYYGIEFEEDGYTLFKGATPSADPARFKVDIPSSVLLTSGFIIDYGGGVTISGLLFNKGSGAVASCCNGNPVITFRDRNSSMEKTITVNKLGAFILN